MNNMKLNGQITFLRKEKGITQEELARVLGVTNQAVSKWESGQCCPDIGLLPDISDYFGVSIDELMGHKVKKTSSVDITDFPSDPQLDKAIGIAEENERISTAVLQRKLRLGYMRCKSLIKRMEELGYIVKDDSVSYDAYLWQEKNNP